MVFIKQTELRTPIIFNCQSWVDKEQNILSANKAFAKMVGVPQTKLAGRKCYEIVHGRDAPISSCPCQKTIEAQGTVSTEAEDPHLGQGIFLFTTSPVFDDKGAVKWVIHTIKDITKRKSAEEALLESRRVLLESQEVAQIGGYVLDIPSGVWRSSKVLDDIFGIGEKFERTIEGWASLIHPEWRQTMIDYLTHEVLEKRGFFDKEYKIIRRNDQAELWVHGRGELGFDAAGEPVRMIGTIQDITERKQAEEELRELASFAELNPAPVLRFGPDGRVIHANPAAYQIFGEDTLEGKLIAEILPTMSNIDIGKYIMEGQIDLREITIGEKDFQFVIQGIPDLAVGHVYGSDITERKQVKETLLESEKRYRTLVESSTDAIISIDERRVITLWNPAAQNIQGYSRDEAIGKPLDIVIPEKYQDLHKKGMKRFIKTGTPKVIGKTVELEAERKDGEIIPIELSLSAVKIKDGYTFTGILRDVTERKRAEEEIQKAVRELEFIRDINIALNTDVSLDEVIQMITDGLTSIILGYDTSAVYFIDPDKKHVTLQAYSTESKIVKKIERLTGIKVQGYRAPILKGSIISRIIETQTPVLTDDMGGVVRENTDNKILKKFAPQIAKFSGLKSGVGAPLISSEGVIGIIGVGSRGSLSEDDAKRLTLFGNWTALAIEKAESVKRLEKAYKELEASDKLKDLFIDIMKHDLLNPAGAVRLAAELALGMEEDRDKKENLQIILRNDEKIIGMIENASILARLESGEKLEFQESDLGSILKTAVSDVASLADEKNMTIKLKAEGVFPALVNPLVHDVFSNLLSNAIKYGPEDSTVAAVIEDAGKNWRISVADNGEGIPDRDKEEIFERFKRIEKGAVKGTGLGLP